MSNLNEIKTFTFIRQGRRNILGKECLQTNVYSLKINFPTSICTKITKSFWKFLYLELAVFSYAFNKAVRDHKQSTYAPLYLG